MNNPGVYTLCALQITVAQPQELFTPILGLDGMTAVTFDADFRFGGGSGTAIAIVATSLDGGTTWRHIARFDFANASLVKGANVEGLLSRAITTYADLVAEGVNDGLLGDRLAVFLTTTGTYSNNTTLSVRASVR